MKNFAQCLLMKCAFFSFLLPLGCTESFQAEYANPGEQEIIDEKWNPTDANKTSEVLIKSMLEKAWLEDFRKGHPGAKPVVIVDDIENRTDDHNIDTKAIGKGLEDELINSGKIRFIDKAARENILKEIKYHNESGMVNQATAKKKGKQTGADFFLRGQFSNIVSEAPKGGYKTVTYQTIVQLVDLETSEIVWSQKYDIKKKFKRSRFGF